MPRNVRNAWVDVNIDGRESTVSGGPRNKDGGLRIDFKQRNNGAVEDVLEIRTYTDSEDRIITYVKNLITKEIVFEHVTQR